MPESPSSEPAESIGSQNLSAHGQSAEWGWSWVFQVYALFSLAVSGPMFARLQERTSFLVSLATVTILVFIVIWSVIVPGIVVLAIHFLKRSNGRLATIAMNGFTALMSLLLMLETFSHRLSGGGFGVLTLIACFVGGCFGMYLPRFGPVRSLLNVAAVGSLLFPISLLAVYCRDTTRPSMNNSLEVCNSVPVVMVVFDCLCGVSLMDQNRMIDVDRYPRFAELARSSNWYRNCTSVHPRTDRAVPAILTGQFRRSFGPPTLKEHPQNLFTLLNAGKYELTAFEPFTSLCPHDKFRDRSEPNLWTQWILVTHAVTVVILHDLIPPDVPIETPPVPREWFGLGHVISVDRDQRHGVVRYSWDLDRSEQFAHFLDCIHETDERNLWFGHFALPHFPWNYLPTGNRYKEDSGLNQVWGTEGLFGENWVDDELPVLQANQQYLLQLGYTDRLIGRLIDRLRETNLYDRCLLVVMADHGIAFKKGMSGRLPTDKNLAEIMSVPLFIKLPNQKTGDVIDLNVQTTDVLPTILDVLKLTPPVAVQGRSVIATQFSELPTKLFTDGTRDFVVDASFDGKYQVLAEQIGKFGTGADPLKIYRVGPHSELLGKSVSEVTIQRRSGFQIHPINYSNVAEYREKSLVPVYLQSQITPAVTGDEPIEFAIAVNEKIWGTTRTYRVSYLRDYWSVMLPEAAFSTGENQIRIFQVTRSPEGISLSECSFGVPAPTPILPMD